MSDTTPGLFISATGTEVGKTYVARGLTHAMSKRMSIAAIKPIETGCVPEALDAMSLARCCGRPELANAPGLYRAAPPLSPQAVTLRTGEAAPDTRALASCVLALAATADFCVVEGAGGLLVPLNESDTMAELACAIGHPLIIVAPDALGVLSHVLSICECAATRALQLAAVVLVQGELTGPDESRSSNQQILARRLQRPVLLFPHCDDDDDELAQAAADSGLLDIALALHASKQ